MSGDTAMALSITNITQSYCTNHTLFGNGYAMLTLLLAVAVAAVSAMMMPAKRMFVK